MTEKVDFSPSKKLFIEILTKDIDIHDCILDLLDNSVDSYTRNKPSDKRMIKLDFDKNKIEIFDNCGGLPCDLIKNKVFRFGVETFTENLGTIGFYGLGLKRSIFKLGKSIIFETDDKKEYCRLDINVEDWLKNENEWRIPLKKKESSKLGPDEKGYAKIKITKLNQETKETIDVPFENYIKETIQIYYTRFIENKIDFYVNGEEQKPSDIDIIRKSKRYSPEILIDTYNGVKIQIACWIELKFKVKEKRITKKRGYQGWNIFMNDRLIINDAVSKLTGWSGKKTELPKYHSLWNEFRGVVFLSSEDPSRLPINTLKNGFNTENRTYHYLLKKMVETARPVINYLRDKYNKPKEELEEGESKLLKEISADVIDEKIEEIAIESFNENLSFKAPIYIGAPTGEKIAKIKYEKPYDQVSKLKKYLKVRTNAEVGIKTFDYYWKLEELDNE